MYANNIFSDECLCDYGTPLMACAYMDTVEQHLSKCLLPLPYSCLAEKLIYTPGGCCSSSRHDFETILSALAHVGQRFYTPKVHLVSYNGLLSTAMVIIPPTDGKS